VECDDFDRTLNKRGEKDAPFIAQRLKQHGGKPDIIISSPAKRALSTAKIIASGLGLYENTIKSDINLYLTSPQDYLQVIRQIDDKYDTVFIIGHNPAIMEICEGLSGTSIDNIPTCGVFCIGFDTSFFDTISTNKGKKLFFDFPKNTINLELNIKIYNSQN
jgi:phosphohistidine phosphatase